MLAEAEAGDASGDDGGVGDEELSDAEAAARMAEVAARRRRKRRRWVRALPAALRPVAPRNGRTGRLPCREASLAHWRTTRRL